MAIKYQVAAITGEYTDKEGKQRKRYVNMGIVMDTKNGGLCMKIESIPVGWDGFAYLNEPREKQEGRAKEEPQFDPNEDIPF
jgi:hypothetical protein